MAPYMKYKIKSGEMAAGRFTSLSDEISSMSNKAIVEFSFFRI